MNTREILDALAEHHRSDLYAEEVQCASADLRRLDAVAMRRAASARLIGYEVKVSRADMRRDTKLVGYLECVDHLFVVCPRELLTPLDLPDDLGLIWVRDGRLEFVRSARRPRNGSADPAGKGVFLDSLMRNRGSWARRSTLGKLAEVPRG